MGLLFSVSQILMWRIVVFQYVFLKCNVNKQTMQNDTISFKTKQGNTVINRIVLLWEYSFVFIKSGCGM